MAVTVDNAQAITKQLLRALPHGTTVANKAPELVANPSSLEHENLLLLAALCQEHGLKASVKRSGARLRVSVQ